MNLKILLDILLLFSCDQGSIEMQKLDFEKNSKILSKMMHSEGMFFQCFTTLKSPFLTAGVKVLCPNFDISWGRLQACMPDAPTTAQKCSVLL